LFNSNARRNSLLEDELFSLPLVRTYLQPGFQQGEENSFTFGKIRNVNIGYIHFEHVGENFYELNTFLNAFPNVTAYIIDLRHNQGGDFTYCFSEIGRLTNQSRFVFSSQTKNGPKATDYTSWHQWFIHPKGEYVNKPIIVLADRYTISAGERALIAFKTLPNVAIVGDTSSGAHGTMIGRELANGWFYSLVPQKVIMSDGKSYEGIGIAPDYYIKNQLSDMQQGIDATLDYAIDLVD
jgi:C-terminal processing protease CtpA/Prc